MGLREIAFSNLTMSGCAKLDTPPNPPKVWTICCVARPASDKVALILFALSQLVTAVVPSDITQCSGVFLYFGKITKPSVVGNTLSSANRKFGKTGFLYSHGNTVAT